MAKRGLVIWLILWPALVGASNATPPGKDSLAFDVSGGITLSSGNSSQTVINGGYNFIYNKSAFGYKSKLEVFYGHSNGSTEVNNGSWDHSVLHSLNKRLNLSGNLGIEYDRVAQIGSRTNLDLGVLYKLNQSDRSKTDLSASIRGEYLRGIGETEDRKSTRLALGLANECSLSETAAFKLNCQLIPNLLDPIRDYRLELQSSLSVLMKRPVWLTLKIRERYSSQTQDETVKNNDLTLVTALTLSF